MKKGTEGEGHGMGLIADLETQRSLTARLREALVSLREAESQNQALQKRAERAELLLREWLRRDGSPLNNSLREQTAGLVVDQLLSPTQETDPE